MVIGGEEEKWDCEARFSIWIQKKKKSNKKKKGVKVKILPHIEAKLYFHSPFGLYKTLLGHF